MNLPRSRPLDEAGRLAWLRLARTDGVGPATFAGLIERFGTAEAALAAIPHLARRGGRVTPLVVPTEQAARRELEGLAKIGARLVALCEPDYPLPLAAIDDAPPVLAVRGDVALLERPSVAIVGARNASLTGRKMAEGLARALAAGGFVVVSGLARGIDAAAHNGALEGGTVAVVAGGVDVVYPPEHAALQERIAAQGCVVAECRLGTEPRAQHFPRRNRIISGLAMGVVVVEAAHRSGSLITARLAGEQGREVFAVPGSPLDARAAGSNNLLRQGAVLTETADDVLRVLMGQPRPAPRTTLFEPGRAIEPSEDELEAVRTTVLERLSFTPVAVDELVRDCHFSAGAVLTALIELELAGLVERHPGNRVSRLPS